MGQAGLGITYLAAQVLLGSKVCIKEFFFKEYCERNETTSHVSLGTQSNHEIVDSFVARAVSTMFHIPTFIRIYRGTRRTKEPYNFSQLKPNSLRKCINSTSSQTSYNGIAHSAV